MPIAKPTGPAGFAIARFKRMRRLQHAGMPAFRMTAVAHAADAAAAQAGLEAVLRAGDALLQKLDANRAEPEVAPDDELAKLEPLTTD
jgi:hypothetical protein